MYKVDYKKEKLPNTIIRGLFLLFEEQQHNYLFTSL